MDELELHDIQGILGGNYGRLDRSAYLLLRIETGQAAAARSWLAGLRSDHWIDNVPEASLLARHRWGCGATIAISAPGLRKLGLGHDAMRGFVSEFQEGMPAPHRARLLGDVGESDPAHWTWGAGQEIDILLILHAREVCIDRYVDNVMAIPGCPGLQRRIDGFVGFHEPFGFGDGISQPRIEGLPGEEQADNQRLLKAGEFVLGYLNETGHRPASPSFGRNGSYLVLRQLYQNVPAFNLFTADREDLGARMVGRWKSGAPLVRYGADPGGKLTENDFSYHGEDRAGFRCPIGAHIRRANPRDALAEAAGLTPDEARRRVDQHRILRRGRIYSDEKEVGLMFLCLNANLERQFEFVQQNWIMHPEFGGLHDETDPLLGNCPARVSRDMTLQDPLQPKRVTGLQQFVSVRGGGYFFLPGLRALDFLAAL